MNVQPIRETMQWFDSALAAIREGQARKGEPINITCGKGCFACCDEPLKVLEGEVDLILADMTVEEKEALKLRVQAWLYQAVKVHKLSSVTTNDVIMADGKKINAFQYRAMKLTCPLLKDGLCSVYANRPHSCRMHLAVGPSELRRPDLAPEPDVRNDPGVGRGHDAQPDPCARESRLRADRRVPPWLLFGNETWPCRRKNGIVVTE
jgi:Fe-S-cluster containining protein